MRDIFHWNLAVLDKDSYRVAVLVLEKFQKTHFDLGDHVH